MPSQSKAFQTYPVFTVFPAARAPGFAWWGGQVWGRL
jgi:hypothetical protein